MLLRLTLILFLSSSTIYAQDCNISDLIVEAYACENDSFLIDLDFNFDNVGDNGFQVMGNGNNYGTFSYDSLFLTLGPLPADETAWEFIVKDVDQPDCAAVFELGSIECEEDCNLFELSVVIDECTSDSTYRVIVDFLHENTNGDHFDLFANGNFFGFYEYTSLPLTISDFPKSGNNVDWLKVCDNDNADCCAVKEYESPNCGEGDCLLSELTVETGNCTSDSTYLIIINFNHETTIGDHFDLFANGEFFGFYAYSELPLTIEHFPQSGNDNDWVKVCDNDNADCCAVKEYASPECGDPCNIRDLNLTFLDCTSDTTYAALIDFNHSNTGEVFDVYTNGIYYGDFMYENLPLLIEDFPVSGNDNDWVKVCDNDHADCCAIKEYESPNCGNADVCRIWDLVYDITCMGDSFSVTLDFNYQNVGDHGFKVAGNGNIYDIFNYADLPVTVGPLPVLDMQYEFVVLDQINIGCSEAVEVGEIDCGVGDCEIWGLETEVLECTSDSTYNLWVNFNSSHDGGIGFDLWVNGTYYEFYLYEDLPLVIEDFPMSECGFDWIKVCDNDNDDCCATLGWESPECEGNEACNISEIVYEIDCVDNEFWLTVNFQYENVGDNGFELRGNGTSYGIYEYGALPVTIGPLPADETAYELVVIDQTFEGCHQAIEIGQIDCSGEACELWDLITDFVGCTSDSTYDMLINFNYQGVAGLGFDVYINGDHFGFYSYDDLPVLLEDVPLRDAAFQHIKVCENDNGDCCVVKEFESPNCDMTDINDPNSEEVKFYPNPTRHILKSTQPVENIIIRDINGTVINIPSIDEQSWDTSRLAPGYYILHINNGGSSFPFVKL